MQTTTGIVLAAGQGTRMKSAVPKMMHLVCGLPIVHYGVQAALDAGCGEVVVVVGQGRDKVEDYLARAFKGRPVRTAVQEQQRGTGDAARVGLATIGKEALEVLVMNGDVPLVTGEHLRAVTGPLLSTSVPVALSFATCLVDDPAGYGRVLRKGGQVVEIREDRDLRSQDERDVREINAGIYVANIALLREALATLAPNNAQGELYLTDIVAFSSNAGEHITAVTLPADVLAGVNDRDQLVKVERTMHARVARKWRIEGATVRDGARVDAGVVLEADCTVESGAVLRGATRIERGATVDVGCVLTDVVVGAGAVVKPYSVATGARIGARAHVGPFAHLRPGSDLGEEAHVGNFVETKKTTMGRGAKANHLAYLGDGVIGDGANIGAGTIFCNYDGFQKHTTTIEAGAFIGSDSQLVAPVTVGANAYVATGTTVTNDVPPNALAISRVKQENKEGYASRLRERMKASKEAKGK
ncbi:MAG: bifunctional UDP-N-acetylglucosamine diphosphorylase/glucosamine-1-phosphate N-acetyltransferase GlmU [Polyangiaceae bacterium]|jgi:bifunctional UDP-N-acetylglucosamine pyrophosphorylase / glucosamine-1-phosphate N-acetyltransferase